MALAPKLSNAAASAAADAVTALLDDGYLRIYDGSQPSTANTAITSQVLLAELRFHSTAFGAAVNGAAEANSISPDTSANATGTASWFRALKSDGATAVFDGSIGTSFSNIVLSSTSITAGETVDITTFTYTQSKT